MSNNYRLSHRRFILPLFILLLGCSKNDVHTKTLKSSSQHISVLTQHNDNTRAGLNMSETELTVTNVNTHQFGKLFTVSVDDQVYSQPLVYGNLAIAAGTHNVVFIATVSNSVYAFDGDNGTLYWNKNYTEPGMRPPFWRDMASEWCSPYTNFTSNIGIVGTPVIDSVSLTMYFVARSTNGSHFIQKLHAISILDGVEKQGSPIEIAASVNGTGDGSANGIVNFDPMRNNQRQGLTLVNGIVYITYSSHCDWNPYHGWIIGYDSHTLQQKIVYNDTPTGENGGIWESGMGMAADAQGNLYVTTGNGTVGQGNHFYPTNNGTGEDKANPDPTDLTNRSESALRLTPSGNTLQITSYFTPTNYLNLNVNDLDYGVMGTLLIPNSNFYFTGCKDGNLYLLNKDNMGGYSPTSNQIQQTIPINVNLHCQPAYYNGSSKEFVFVWSENDQLRALSFNRSSNLFDNHQIVSSLPGPTGQSGAVLSVSSNGVSAGTGILWAAYAIDTDAENVKGAGILRAFDASDITKELWNSKQGQDDSPGDYAKFSSPTIANGHVYLATFSNQIVVYGLK
jgi:outer membrane protein assembly factor BamB